MDADRGLVEAAAAGSRDAFDELVRRYQAPIVSLTRALTGGSADAEDLAQEIFVRMWKSIGGFRGESTFRTWLHRIALNVISTHHGRMVRLRRLFLTPAAEHDPLEHVPGRGDVESDVVRRQAIDRALASLPDELRVAVTLRDVQGLEYKEIAEVMGVPIGTVESRIFRARQRLRPMLEPFRRGGGV